MDRDFIYSICITPGVYLPKQLEEAINEAFRATARCADVDAIGPYDEHGYNRYHQIHVSISPITDIVTFCAYRELLQCDLPTRKIITIPDYYVELTMAENLAINFGTNGTNIVPQIIRPFDPATEELLIYFTEKTHIRIREKYCAERAATKCYPYANRQLYQYVEHTGFTTIKTPGCNTFLMKRLTNRALLVNFYRDKNYYPLSDNRQEINSVNTTTILSDFVYQYSKNEVYKPNHRLNESDLIITDQFFTPTHTNIISVYQVNKIIDRDQISGEPHPFWLHL